MNAAVINWLLTCPNVKYLYALFGTIEDNTKHLIRLDDGEYKARHIYTDGTARIYLYSDFVLNCFDSATFQYQPPATSENLTEYANAQAICDWITTKDNSKSYPTISGETVVKVEPRPTNPQIAGIDENQIAKYVVGLRIYFDGKVINNAI